MQKNRQWLVLILHLAGWVLFFTLQVLLHAEWRGRYAQGGFNGPPPPARFGATQGFPYVLSVMSLLMVPMFYANVYFIFPRFIALKKYGLFLLTQVGIIGCLMGSVRILKFAFYGASQRPLLIQPVLIYIVITSIAFCYTLIQESINAEKLQKEKENETLKSELLFLRWQISPHFLFNALNNIVALSRVKSDRLEPMLLRLSTLMRYMLYDTDEKRVSLGSEAEYLQSYVSLQSIRVGKEVAINTAFNIPEHTLYMIEPMLLIPFVENAFKHGIGNGEDAVINIAMQLSGNVLHFSVGNRIFAPEASPSAEVHGIGLANVRRRLNLLYDDRFTLDIDQENEWFMVMLQITLA